MNRISPSPDRLTRLAKRCGMLALGLAVLTAASCTYRVAVRAAPSHQAYAFEDRLPARAGIFVDGDQLWRNAGMIARDNRCADSNYPIDARDALEQSILGTLEPLIEEVRLSESRIAREDMDRLGIDTVIAVRAEVFDVTLTGGGLFRMEAAAALSLAVSVFTEDGLLFREVVMGNAVQAGSGMSCGAGAKLLSAAAEIAIENSMTDLGELIVNAPGLRKSFGSAPRG